MRSIDRLREYVKDAPASSMGEMARAIVAGMADEIEREVEQYTVAEIDALPMTDENMAESGWVRLPVDADGAPIHIEDVMETDNGIREVDVLQKSSRKWSVGLVPVGGGAFSWHDAETLRHYHAPTVEDVLQEFADEVQRCCDTADTIAEYAAKLRLAGEE